MTTEPLAAIRPAGLLRGGDFVRLWAGQAVSQLGDRMHHVALMWWVIAETGSLALAGAIMIATTLPTVLLGPIAGTLADRLDRRTLMVGSDVARAVLVGGVGALALAGQLSFPVLVAASALLSALSALFTPANMAMVPAVVEKDDLLRANSLMETTLQGAALFGPALGGLLVAVAGAPAAFGFNALSFLVSALLLGGLRARPVPGAAGEAFWTSLVGGFRLLGRLPTIAGLLISFACLNFFTVAILLFLPHFAKSVFAVGPAGLGALEAAVALGMGAAAFAWARAGRVGRRFPVIFGAVAGTAALYAVMGLVPRFEVYLAALAAVGALIGSLNVLTMSYFQSEVPAAEMGRFMGLLTSLVFGLMPLSYGLFGLLSSVVAPETLLLCNAGAIAMVAAALWAVPGLKRI